MVTASLEGSSGNSRHEIKGVSVEPSDHYEGRGFAPVQDDPDADIIQGITHFIDQLPSLPMVVQRMLHILQRDEATTREVAEVINLDPALAAKLLKLVNSALYALQDPVTTVHHAVTIAGFMEVRNLALGMKLMESLPGADKEVLDRTMYWEHSLACALCARGIASAVSPATAEEAFLGGLLHDMGKLVLSVYFGEQWREALEAAEAQGRPPLEVEAELIGAPHTVVGQMLAHHWRLPRLPVMAIGHHHELPPAGDMSNEERLHCAMIAAADNLVRWMDLGSSGYSRLSPLQKELSVPLGLEDSRTEVLLRETARALSDWKAVFGLNDDHANIRACVRPEPDAPTRAPRLWVIGPAQGPSPSVRAMVAAMGYEVHASHWGEGLLRTAAEMGQDAILMDLRGLKVATDGLTSFLRAMRSRSPSPILLIHSGQVPSPSPELGPWVASMERPPSAGRLNEWLRHVLRPV